MSNLVPTNVKVPAHIAARVGTPSALAQSLAGGIGGGADFPRISLKGSRFRIKDGDTETVLQETALDIVIVGANPRLSKTWYANAWDPNAEPAAPDCFSLDGIRPDSEAENPQNDLCATCEHNAWGSKLTPQGVKIKACGDQKRLAVVAADDPSGPVYLLQVTPAALKGLNQYQKELSMRGIPPEVVKTRITFDTDASFPKLMFGFGGFLDEAGMAAVDDLFGSAKVKEITGEEGRNPPAQIAAPAEKPKPTLVKAAEPAPAPAPAAAPAAPKRGFGSKAAAPAAEAAPAPAAAPAKPKAAPKVAAPATNIADEIEALISEATADDQ